MPGTLPVLREALGELQVILAAGDGPVRLDEDGDLVISPLAAEHVPAEATALEAGLPEMLLRLRVDHTGRALPVLFHVGLADPDRFAETDSGHCAGMHEAVDGHFGNTQVIRNRGHRQIARVYARSAP